jgi:formylglycine-generating enzyme required for sulfatase activity
VQVITLDQGERPRPEIARKWISHLAAAIRRLDKEHLVTVGMVDWSLDRPGLTSGFVPERVSADLDFLCVHIYPRSGKLDDALATLKGFAIGKPVVIEEMFPLSCTAAELDDFLNRAQEHVAGGIGFYWGKTPEEYRKGGTIGDAIVLAWLELFQKRAKSVPRLPDGEAPKDKQTAVNSLNMKLVLIPAGEFQMGASDDDADAEDHERPRHRVRIARPFYLATHETTVGAFRKFVDATGYKTTAETDGKGSSGYDEQTRGFVYGRPGYTWKSLGWRQEDDHPVLNVSWHDAVAFCQWLSEKEGQRYRLPTEAEWEYACRAGTTTRFFSGDRLEDVRGVANVLDESLIARWEAAARDLNEGKPHRYNVPVAWDDGFAFTAPVGSFKANPLGLYDVHGNVWEWCSDWYDKDYYKTSPADDPPGAKEGKGRVTRGGAFLSSPKVSRSSMRNSGFPDYHNYVIGFRVVREVGE